MSILFWFTGLEKNPPRKLLQKIWYANIWYAKKTGMLNIRYAKNTYGPKCQNTHGPKLWLLDTWAWAHGPGRMGRRRPAAAAAGEG